MDIINNEQYLVLKNQYSRHPGCKNRFINYCSFCITKSKEIDSIQEAVAYLDAASVAIDVYSEKSRLNAAKVSLISKLKEMVESQYQVLHERITEAENLQAKSQAEAEKSRIKSIEQENQSTLESISDLQIKLKTVRNQQQFDDCIKRLTDLDNSLIKDFFTEEQNKLYTTLSEKYSVLVSDKMAELQKKKDEEYNRKALIAFRDVFTKVRENEKALANFDSSAREYVKPLFSYSMNRLSSEVQIYYNHVYSYIFAKLKDDGKFEITKMSLEINTKNDGE